MNSSQQSWKLVPSAKASTSPRVLSSTATAPQSRLARQRWRSHPNDLLSIRGSSGTTTVLGMTWGMQCGSGDESWVRRQKKLDSAAIAQLIKALVQTGCVKISGTSVSYAFPKA